MDVDYICDMKMKNMGARIEKRWKGGGCRLIERYKYHCLNATIKTIA